MSDTIEKLGTHPLLTDLRDAVHIAVIPQTAETLLQPGQWVGDNLGVVDPFLQAPVKPGQTYWLFLAPMSITSLRHVWTHPAFPEESPVKIDKSVSLDWMSNFAGDLGPFSATELIETTRYYLDRTNTYADGTYICMGSDLNNCEIAPNEEFWTHYENLTGEKVNRSTAPTNFRCAC